MLNAVVWVVPSLVEVVVGAPDVEAPDVEAPDVSLAVVGPELAELAVLASVIAEDEDEDDPVPPSAGSGSASAAQATKRLPHKHAVAIDRIETLDVHDA